MTPNKSTYVQGRALRGYSLTELLVTMTVLLLVSAIMAAGVPSALRAYTDVVDASNAQVLLATTVTRLRDELSMANPDERTMDIDGDKKVSSFTSLETGYKVSFAPNNKGNLCKQEEASGPGASSDSEPVKTLLIPTKNADIGSKVNLCVTYESIKYDESKGVFEVSGLKVVDYTPDSSGEEPEGLIEGDTFAGAQYKGVLEIRLLAAP